MLKRAVAVVIVSVGLADFVLAGPLEDGIAAYDRGDYVEALQLLQPLAEHGDPNAQYKLGVMFARGQGVPEDGSEALRWYKTAAERGSVDAQALLGLMYSAGVGGVRQDYVLSYMWYSLAAARGSTSATILRDSVVAANMTDVQVGEAQILAAQWLAEQGDVVAQFNLGIMYQTGHGATPDYVEAMGWYRRAAENGSDRALFNIGILYEEGLGVPRDRAEALKWYRRAAEHGYAAAQAMLGIMFARGTGVPQDFVLAHVWFNLAAAQGDQSALEGRDMVASMMSPAQLAEAQRLARVWKPTSER